jgi:hypothetical protein
MADHLPFMLRLRGSQGLGSLIDEISLALHAPDAAELRRLASGLRVRCSANLAVSDSAGKCYDVPVCTANRENGCRVVPPATGPYRDMRANMEQTWPWPIPGPAHPSDVFRAGSTVGRVLPGSAAEWLGLGLQVVTRCAVTGPPGCYGQVLSRGGATAPALRSRG